MSHTTITASDTLAYRLEDAGRLLGLSRASLYRLITDGRLTAVKIAGRTLIPAESLRALVASAPAANIHLAPRSAEGRTVAAD